VAGFRGFTDDTLTFFTDLEANNDRSWWTANKARFERHVREPMRLLLDDLVPTYGEFHVFRMNRDTRFSKDKSPYKTQHAGVSETDGGGATYYLHVSQAGLFVGAGLYHPARDQLARYRAAVDDDTAGGALEAAVVDVRSKGVDVTPGEGALATAPRGVAKDHPRIELLRWKGCIASRDLGCPAWLKTRRVVREVAGVWDAARPLVAWLDTNVGASELAPDSVR
jgi:uncharacterized protein (TIGR02453 family)